MVCISRGDLGYPAPDTRPCLLYHVTEPLWCHPAEDSGGWWHQLLYSITHFSYINAEDWLTFKISGKQLYRAKLCCSGKNNQPTNQPPSPQKNTTNLKKSGSLWRYCFSFFFCTWKTEWRVTSLVQSLLIVNSAVSTWVKTGVSRALPWSFVPSFRQRLRNFLEKCFCI